MRDQRIMEMLEGRLQPQIRHLPLLERVVGQEINSYDENEQEQLQRILQNLKENKDRGS